MKTEMESIQSKTVAQVAEKEQEKQLEKNRRRAFLGVQLKYTLTPICLLYGIVFAVLVGLFLLNLVTKVSGNGSDIPFLAQIRVLPLEVGFVALIVGVQVILNVGFSKQGKHELALLRIPLPEETRRLLRLGYSLLVTLSAFAVYFLMLNLMLVLENILAPETAYGFAELYPVFYSFTHLYRVYPVANGMAWIALPVVIANCSVMSPLVDEARRKGEVKDAVWSAFALCEFLFYCFDEGNQAADFVLMMLFGGVYIGRVFFAYRRRQKDDRAELV